MFHKHDWDIVHTEFVSGVMNRFDMVNLEVKGFVDDKIMYGYTEVSMICRVCGEPRIKTMVGRFQERA